MTWVTAPTFSIPRSLRRRDDGRAPDETGGIPAAESVLDLRRHRPVPVPPMPARLPRVRASGPRARRVHEPRCLAGAVQDVRLRAARRAAAAAAILRAHVRSTLVR